MVAVGLLVYVCVNYKRKQRKQRRHKLKELRNMAHGLHGSGSTAAAVPTSMHERGIQMVNPGGERRLFENVHVRALGGGAGSSSGWSCARCRCNNAAHVSFCLECEAPRGNVGVVLSTMPNVRGGLVQPRQPMPGMPGMPGMQPVPGMTIAMAVPIRPTPQAVVRCGCDACWNGNPGDCVMKHF